MTMARSFFVAFAGLAIVVSPAWAAQSAEQAPVISGHVETPDGHPANGATVWLVRDQEEPVTLAETSTDDQGRFTFTNLPDAEQAQRRHWNAWAQDASGRLGWIDNLADNRRQPGPLLIRLLPVADFQARLVDHQGQPIAGASIKTELISDQPLGANTSYGRLPIELSGPRRVTTSADGSFVIAEVLSRGMVFFHVTAPGFGTVKVGCNVGRPFTLRLAPAVAWAGVVDWPAGYQPSPTRKAPLGELWLRAYATYDATGQVVDPTPPTYSVGFYRSIVIAADGSFGIDELPPGDYQLNASFAADVPLRGRQDVTLTLAAGQSMDDFRLPVDPAHRITGHVLGFTDKQPVAGATVQLWRIHEGVMRHEQRVTTDAEGWYQAHARNGSIMIQVVEAPEQYVPLNPETFRSEERTKRVPTLNVEQETEWPDLLLDPAGDLVIEVVDEEGRPVPDAVVNIVTPAGYPAGGDYRSVPITDRQGRYVARRVTQNDTLPIRVHTPDAISDPNLVVTPGELSGPIRVVLSAQHGFRIQGRVINARGQPMAGARIDVSTSFPYVSKWVETGLSRSGHRGIWTTDAEGTFTTGPLWPDTTYRVTALAEGYDPSEAPQTSGREQTVVELKRFVLAETQRVVGGVVVDEQGNPLERVRVFAGGRNWRMATTVTDAAGRFELNELAPDPRYVFADAVGYRLGGVRVGGDQPSVTITLRSNDAAPRGLRSRFEPDRKDQLDTARQLLEQAWSLPTHPRSTARIAMLEAMTRIDPNYALVMSSAGGGHFDDTVRYALARQIVRDDPQRAVDSLQQARGNQRFEVLLQLARQLADSNDPERRPTALRLAELAEGMIDQQSPFDYGPRLAQVLTRLGQEQRARALVEQAMTVFAKSDPESFRLYQLQALAVALAPFDYDAALQIATRVESGYSRTETMAEMAVAIAGQDVDEAIRRLETLEGDGNTPAIRDRARLQIAMQLVDTDLERAIQLVQQCDEAGHQAQALGRLAVRVAEVDQPRAWQMIDEALAIHRSEQNAYQSWYNFGEGGPFAAALAYQAWQVDYPDLESVIWHVRVAACAKGSVTAGQQRLLATIGTARILALVDQVAARELLLSVADDEEQLARRDGGVSLFDQWLQAWLMVDFQHGVLLLQQDLKRLADSGAEDPLRRGHGAVFRLLVAAEEDRYGLITADETGLWE